MLQEKQLRIGPRLWINASKTSANEVQGCSDQGCEEAVDESLQDRMIRSEQDRLFEETLSIDAAKMWT